MNKKTIHLGSNFSQKLDLWVNSILIVLFFMLMNASILKHYILVRYDFYNIHRIGELLIFGMIFLRLFFPSQAASQGIEIYRNLPLPAQTIIPFFFFWGLLSCLDNGFSADNLLWVAHIAALLLSSLYIASLVRQNPSKIGRILLFLVVISSAYYMFFEWMYYGITQYFTHFLPGISLDMDKLIPNLRYPGYSNPRFLGQVLSWILPLVILPYVFFKPKNKPLSFLFLLIAAGLWQMFWMGQSRALYLELLVCAVLIPVLFHKQPLVYRYLKAQGLALLLGLILYMVLYHLSYSLPERSFSEEGGDSGRFMIWHFTISLILQNPLYGIGPLNFIHYGAKLFNISHPHNAALFFTVEWGIPAGLALIFLTLWGLKTWVQFSRKISLTLINANPAITPSSENLLFIIAITTSLLAGFLNSGFSGTLLMPASQMCLGLVLGWSLGIYQSNQTANPKDSPILGSRRSQIFLRIIILILAGLILKGIFPTVLKLPEEQNQACLNAADTEHPFRCPIIPSYWANHPGMEGTLINIATPQPPQEEQGIPLANPLSNDSLRKTPGESPTFQPPLASLPAK